MSNLNLLEQILDLYPNSKHLISEIITFFNNSHITNEDV